MPYLLERALICEKINWRLLPDELDERSVELAQALSLIRVFRTHQHAGEDQDSLTKDEAELIDYVIGLRKENGDDQ